MTIGHYVYDEEGSHFGAVVATAGDVNADGYSDVIIGVPDYDGGQVLEGMAALFYGSATGLEESIGWQQGERPGGRLLWLFGCHCRRRGWGRGCGGDRRGVWLQ